MQALLLVGDDRIGLGVGPEADALAQVLHGVDVVHPVLVHHPQHDDPLQLPHDGRRDFLFLCGVDLHGLIGEHLDKRLGGGALDLLGGKLESILGEEGPLQGAHHGPAAVAV